MLEHAAYKLLPLQLLILVLVAHVVHLRHHCSQVNLQNRREKLSRPQEYRLLRRSNWRTKVISRSQIFPPTVLFTEYSPNTLYLKMDLYCIVHVHDCKPSILSRSSGLPSKSSSHTIRTLEFYLRTQLRSFSNIRILCLHNKPCRANVSVKFSGYVENLTSDDKDLTRTYKG